MVFAIRAMLVFAAVVSMTTIARARDDSSALLDRMREHSGPVWRLHLHSTSHLTMNGATTPIATDTDGVRFFVHQCDGALCVGTYFDGLRVYSVNINGTALPSSRGTDQFLRAARFVASLSFLAPDFSDRGGEIEDQGTVSIDGTRYRDLLITIPQAGSIDVYVDPRTNLVRYARDVNGEATLAYGDYRRVDGGVTLPFSVTRNGAPLEHYDTRSVVEQPFEAPSGLRPEFHGTATVPIDQHKVTPVFPCRVGGEPVVCLLDSGNSGISMSLELAERLNAPVVGPFTVQGLGQYATEVVRAGPLVAGNMTIPDAKYVVLHDIHVLGYDVVLGADVLASTFVQIDGAHHTVAFDAPAPGGAINVPISFENFVPVVNVGLSDATARLAVDTGDESNINLSYDYYTAHPSLFRATEQRSVSGIGGTGVELIGRIPLVRIGSFSAREQQIGTTTTLQSTASGHLGAQFLSQFLVTIEYQAGSLQLVPVKPLPTPSPTTP